jgi:hypothetical protein
MTLQARYRGSQQRLTSRGSQPSTGGEAGVGVACSSTILGTRERYLYAFGRVCLAVGATMIPSQVRILDKRAQSQLLKEIEVSGFGKFTREDWIHLIQLRSAIAHTNVAEVFKACQFHVCNGRVHVKAADFGLAAQLEPNANWSMICVMLYQYIGNAETQKAKGSSAFTCRVETNARKLLADAVGQLVEEQDFVLSMDALVIKMLNTYATPSGGNKPQVYQQTELLTVRSHFLSHCGKLLIAIGQKLASEAAIITGKRRQFTPEQRVALIEKANKNKFAELEGWLREELVKKGSLLEGGSARGSVSARKVSRRSLSLPSLECGW